MAIEKNLVNQITIKKHLLNIPKKLYEYRSFDEFTEDMIINKYLYLCQMEKLDDQFECATNFSYDSIFKSEGVIRRAFVDEIADMIFDFSSTLNKKEYKKLIRKCLDKNNQLDIKRTAIVASEKQKGLSEKEAVASLETFGALLAGMWQNENNIKAFNGIKLNALNAR